MNAFLWTFLIITAVVVGIRLVNLATKTYPIEDTRSAKVEVISLVFNLGWIGWALWLLFGG